MIHESVELHNIAEVHRCAGAKGVRLQRVPEHVRKCLSETAKMQMLSPASAEIRFVCDDPPARITLSCPGGGIAHATLFYGMFPWAPRLGESLLGRYVIGQEAQTIEIAAPEHLHRLDPEYFRGMPFSAKVCRLMLGDLYCGWGLHLLRIEGRSIRPPKAQELPPVRYLAYGTSITHGAWATGPHLTYASQAARRLGADLINLGVCGSAHCEPALADHIAGRQDWDFATLALSVNMMGFTIKEFHKRVSYMVNTVAGADTARPVVCITIYPCFREFGGRFDGGDDKGVPEEYRQALRDAVQTSPHPNVHLIEGAEILTDISGLSADLIHPGDDGMILIGQNLAQRLKPLVAGLIARKPGTVD